MYGLMMYVYCISQHPIPTGLAVANPVGMGCLMAIKLDNILDSVSFSVALVCNWFASWELVHSIHRFVIENLWLYIENHSHELKCS